MHRRTRDRVCLNWNKWWNTKAGGGNDSALGWRHHSILPALRRVVDAAVVPEWISGDGDRDRRRRQSSHCRPHRETGAVSKARIIAALVSFVLAPGESPIVL